MKDTITTTELAEKLGRNEGLVLIDVRRKNDLDAEPGLIPGAVWHDPAEAASWASTLPPDRPVVIYCVRGGSVSKSTQDTLRAGGLDVKYVEGGLAAWKEGGGALVPKK